MLASAVVVSEVDSFASNLLKAVMEGVQLMPGYPMLVGMLAALAVPEVEKTERQTESLASSEA